MMLNIFYPMNHDFLVNHNGACISHYWCKWDASNLASMISIGWQKSGRDQNQNIWEQIYNHYVNRRRLPAPYTEAYALRVRPEGGGGDYGPNSSGYDHLGFGTLTFTLATSSDTGPHGSGCAAR